MLPFPKATYTVPSGPTIGCEPWSWSQAWVLASPLKAVQKVAFVPLISMPGDQVAPPLVDWLKKIGLSPPTPAPVAALKRVHVA